MSLFRSGSGELFPLFWDEKEVCGWLSKIGMENYIKSFMENSIDGAGLLELTEDDFERLNIQQSDLSLLKKEIRIITLSLKEKIKEWNVDQVVHWISENGGANYADVFRAHSLDGEEFLELNEDDMAKLQIRPSDRRRIVLLRRIALGQSRNSKTPPPDIFHANEDIESHYVDPRSKPVPVTAYYSPKRSFENSRHGQRKHSQQLCEKKCELLSVSDLEFSKTRSEPLASFTTKLRLPRPSTNVSYVFVKRISDDEFMLKSLKSDDTFHTFRKWVKEEFGPGYAAKCSVAGKMGGIVSDSDVSCVFRLAQTFEVKIFLYARPHY
jgi:hypothetical protein